MCPSVFHFNHLCQTIAIIGEPSIAVKLPAATTTFDRYPDDAIRKDELSGASEEPGQCGTNAPCNPQYEALIRVP